MGYTSPEEQAIDNTKSGLLEKFRNVLETLESIQTDLNIVSKGNYIESYLNDLDKAKIEVLNSHINLRKTLKIL